MSDEESALAERIEGWLKEDGPSGLRHHVFAPEYLCDPSRAEELGEDAMTVEDVESFRDWCAGHIARRIAERLTAGAP